MSIEKHNWFDPDVDYLEYFSDADSVLINLKKGAEEVCVTRNDTIALANHFGLTEEDLRDAN